RPPSQFMVLADSPHASDPLSAKELDPIAGPKANMVMSTLAWMITPMHAAALWRLARGLGVAEDRAFTPSSPKPRASLGWNGETFA
ncbi:MAG TPA: hypothetical protein VKT80_16945, partial [Chloroflexota bacterium]|nr:hypothetical protein [Chloroflexota bacterium]